MNELKPEDVMPEGAVVEALELRAPHDAVCRHALALLCEKDATLEMCAETIERQDKELAKKDAEIERLTKERDLANAEREANVKGFTTEIERLAVELKAMRAAANSYKMALIETERKKVSHD